MWVLLLVFLACFKMGFYFVTTGWIFEISLYLYIDVRATTIGVFSLFQNGFLLCDHVLDL